MHRVEFVDIDEICFMEQVLGGHIRSYQSDFDIDKKMLWEAAGGQGQKDKTFIWLCRTAGTWLLSERDEFLSVMPGSYPDMEYGRLVSLCCLSHEQEDLEDLLWRERQERERYKEGDPDVFTKRSAIQGSVGKKICRIG